MRRTVRGLTGLLVCMGCSQTPGVSADGDATAGIDALNERVSEAYRTRDPKKYGELFTDTAVFEWPALNNVRGRAALEAMVREGWSTLSDMDLKLDVASRRLSRDHATEFGAFQQSFRDTKGVRRVEYGRYVTVLARQPDNSWRIDRFLGFADSTRP
jgi:uncharacterized protein (TIGR02246 family)